MPRFRHLVSRPVALTPDEVADLLDGEVAAGRLSPGEALCGRSLKHLAEPDAAVPDLLPQAA